MTRRNRNFAIHGRCFREKTGRSITCVSTGHDRVNEMLLENVTKRKKEREHWPPHARSVADILRKACCCRASLGLPTKASRHLSVLTWFDDRPGGSMAISHEDTEKCAGADGTMGQRAPHYPSFVAVGFHITDLLSVLGIAYRASVSYLRANVCAKCSRNRRSCTLSLNPHG